MNVSADIRFTECNPLCIFRFEDFRNNITYRDNTICPPLKKKKSNATRNKDKLMFRIKKCKIAKNVFLIIF